MRRWLEPQEINVPPDLQASVGGHPLVAQVLARRGILTPAQADLLLKIAPTVCRPYLILGLFAGIRPACAPVKYSSSGLSTSNSTPV